METKHWKEDPPQKNVSSDPPFIRYMLNPSKKFSCEFLVGDARLGPPEKIGVSKDLLMAHSIPFRRMLGESELAETGTVRVTDIQPDTFRNLLRFVYGHDSFSTMSLEEAVDLLYVAEKYLIKKLKAKLITYISPLVTIDSVCTVLQRPECMEQKGLKDVISEIVQDYTDDLLSQDMFLELNTFGIVTILQQDALAVPEIELWRAVLRWANHNSWKALTLQHLMRGGPLENLRLCTLDIMDFFKEVCPTNILTDQEVALIIRSISTNKELESLKTVSNTIKIRDLTSNHLHEATFYSTSCSFVVHKYDTSLSITTHNFHMLLISASFESYKHSVYGTKTPEGLYLHCECKVTVNRLFDYKTNTNVRARPINFVLKMDVDYGKEFEIPLTYNGQSLKLLSCSKYNLYFEFGSPNSVKFFFPMNKVILSNKNKIIIESKLHTPNSYGSIIKKLTYKSE